MAMRWTMLGSGFPPVVWVALLGGLVGAGSLTGGTIGLFALEYRDAKKPEALHRDAIPAYFRVVVDMDWRGLAKVYLKITGGFGVGAAVLYVFGVGLLETVIP